MNRLAQKITVTEENIANMARRQVRSTSIEVLKLVAARVRIGSLAKESDTRLTSAPRRCNKICVKRRDNTQEMKRIQ